MRGPALLALPALAVALMAGAGCGGASSSTDKTPSSKRSTTVFGRFPSAGISFKAPAGWNADAGRGTLVATVQAGDATIAVWRFPRTERLPGTKDELKAARDALLTASLQRDSTFTEIKTAPTTVAGQPAVQIRAREMIAGRPRTVRSTHIYAHGAEIVIDAYADAGHFRSIDAQVFRPLLRTLRVSTPVA